MMLVLRHRDLPSTFKLSPSPALVLKFNVHNETWLAHSQLMMDSCPGRYPLHS